MSAIGLLAAPSPASAEDVPERLPVCLVLASTQPGQMAVVGVTRVTNPDGTLGLGSGTANCHIVAPGTGHEGNGRRIGAHGTGVIAFAGTIAWSGSYDVCSEFVADSDQVTWYWNADHDVQQWSTSSDVECAAGPRP